MSQQKQTLSNVMRQQQTLAPLQMMYVKVLEMSEPEVEEQVRETLNENPALEVKEEPEEIATQEEAFHESAEQMQRADYLTEDDIPTYSTPRDTTARERYLETVSSSSDRGDTLIETLMAQLGESELPEAELPIAEYIIGSIDDNGYMTRSIERIADDIAMTIGADIPLPILRRVWESIRALDPAGVGAMDLRDCLLLQLQRRHEREPHNRTISVAIEMLSLHFDLFAKKHYDRLRSALSIDEAAMREVIRLIQQLNPKPGSLITGGESDRTRHISPDFVVEHDPDTDRITLTLPSSIPHLQISSSFAADSAPTATTRAKRDASPFIRQRRDEASAFIQALSMRQQTLRSVMEAIIKLQPDFFRTDDATRLRPMVLKDIANITGHDVSVISRATAGKYVATRRGTYPLRFFFSERPNENTDASTHEITDAIAGIIKAEDPKAPLSDAAITERLKELGFDIARRTVTKYRERLGLPVGRLRKKI